MADVEEKQSWREGKRGQQMLAEFQAKKQTNVRLGDLEIQYCIWRQTKCHIQLGNYKNILRS